MGDTHYGEISRLDVTTPYTLWDITSSGLTEVEEFIPPNSLRVGQVLQEQNFGLLTFGGSGDNSTILAQVRDVTGAVRLEQAIRTTDLVVR